MPLDSLSDSGTESRPISAHRPVVMGTRHLVVAGHYLAAHAGFQIWRPGETRLTQGWQPESPGGLAERHGQRGWRGAPHPPKVSNE